MPLFGVGAAMNRAHRLGAMACATLFTVSTLVSGASTAWAQSAPGPQVAPTPEGCHWSDRKDGTTELWCKDASGRFQPTGQIEASNLGVGDGCPTGQFYNGAECVGEFQTSSAPRPPLSPAEQIENNTFLTGLAKSLDEVVTRDSASWLIYRYDRVSMTNARTLAHGKDRRSALVYGEYTFNGGQHGWLKARIANGQYTCLEYWNEHGCRALGHPESHVIAAGLLIAMFAGAMSGGGGGGGGGSYRGGPREILVPQGGGSPTPSYEPAPITPIGGDRGLYGADHSCC